MQSLQNQDASEFEVDVEFQNENGNQTFRDLFHSKLIQLRILYQKKRKYFFIGFIVVVLVMMDIINISLKINPEKSNSLDVANRVDPIKKDDRKETNYNKGSTEKDERDESFSTEINMVTVNYQNTSTELYDYLQKTEFNNSIALLEGSSVWLLNLETKHSYHWCESKNAISVLYFNFEGVPIWFEDESKTTHSLTADYNRLSLPANLKVRAIASDLATGNSYVLDQTGHHLLVFDKHYFQATIILSNLNISLFDKVDIKIDPLNRLVFMLINSKILRCNMNGKSLKTLKSVKNDISAFTLDYTSKRVYHATSTLIGQAVIEYTDYEGKTRKIFYVSETSSHLYSLTFQNDKLIWVQQNGRLYSESPQYIMHCKVDQECSKPSKMLILFQKSNLIAFPNTSEITTDNNPCHLQPPVCDHICILGANNTYTCACDQFHQLSDDMKTCKLAHYFIYLQKSSFRGKFINNSSFSSNDLIPFLPVYFDSEGKLNLEKIMFVKGSKNSEIFVSDNENMYSINLRNAKENKLFTVAGRSRKILSFTFDSEEQRLYVLVDHTQIYKSYLRTYDIDMVFVEFELQLFYESGLSSMTIISNELLLLSYRKTGEIVQFNTLTSTEEVNSEIGKGNQIVLLPKIPADVYSLKFNWLSFKDNITTWNYGSKFDDELTIELRIILPSSLSNVRKGFIFEENLYIEDNQSIWRVQKNSSINANIIFKMTDDIYGITLI